MSAPSTEALNARRFAREGTYEVWYLTWNHAPTGQGFWLRYVAETPRANARAEPPYSQLWFARFDPKDPRRTFGIHRAFPPLAAQTSPFEIAIGESRLAHDRASGALAGDGHTVAWDLRWTPAEQELRLLPDLFYGPLHGETTVLSPNPRVPLSGRIVVDGEALDLAGAVVGQTHLWGTKHAYSWTWAHVAAFTGERSGSDSAVLELLGVQLHRRGITLPRLVLVALDLDGERHRLNQVRHLVRNRGTWLGGQADESTGARVQFEATGARVKISGELACPSERMLVAPYIDPDGTRVYCSNTEIGDARITISRRAGLGWRPVRTLEARGTAHFEIGGRARDPSVTRDHVSLPML